MKLISAEQMRKLDRSAIEIFGISGITLMSNAAEHLAKTALEHIPPGGKVAVFCGYGNNGGDGIGAAAHLLEKGISVRTFLVGSDNIKKVKIDKNVNTENEDIDIYSEISSIFGAEKNATKDSLDLNIAHLTSDSKEMYNRLTAHGGSIENYSPSVDLYYYLNTCAVVIDAILGIGLNSDIKGDTLAAVNAINNSGAVIISADIPTGVHANTGTILGDCVNADITVTFSFAKPGLFIEPGCIKSGDVRIVDIGIPETVQKNAATDKYAVMAEDVTLPPRQRNSHKGNYGRVLIIAGSIGYTGAPALSARAATKMGAGLVSLGVPKPIYTVMAAKLNEEMPFPLASDSKGRLTVNATSDIMRQLDKSNVCLLGPGLGISGNLTELVNTVILRSTAPVVLDADGLNAISDDVDVLKQASCPLVLTPHLGEFVRLGGNLAGDRIKAAVDFASEYGCILVLKGHRTITAFPNGTAYANTTGCPAMAKGGTGDVLAGMIAALIAQEFPVVHAVTASVYLHGLSGDMCSEKFGEYSVTASGLINMLPQAVKQITKNLNRRLTCSERITTNS